MPIKNEIAHAVYSMLEALTVFKDRKELSARIERGADQFNALLASARQSFADSIVLVACLAVLKSALDSELIRLNRGYVPGQVFRSWRHSWGKYAAVEYRLGQLWAAGGPIAFADVDPSNARGDVMQWLEPRLGEFTVHTAS